MFCEHYFLPQAKNIGSIKRYFHTFPFKDCFVFHLITLLLKGFLVLSEHLKTAFEKSSNENSKRILKNNQIISAYCIEVFASKMIMNKRSTTCGLIMHRLKNHQFETEHWNTIHHWSKKLTIQYQIQYQPATMQHDLQLPTIQN